MSQTHPCESCSMPIETGRYCRHCTDANGKLQSFEERFERLIAFQQRRAPGASRPELERAAFAFMARMPAWKDHPKVIAAGADES